MNLSEPSPVVPPRLCQRNHLFAEISLMLSVEQPAFESWFTKPCNHLFAGVPLGARLLLLHLTLPHPVGAMPPLHPPRRRFGALPALSCLLGASLAFGAPGWWLRGWPRRPGSVAEAELLSQLAVRLQPEADLKETARACLCSMPYVCVPAF